MAVSYKSSGKDHGDSSRKRQLNSRVRNHSLGLVRVSTLVPAPVDSRRYVVVSLARCDIVVGVDRAGIEGRVDLRVRTSRRAAPINVIAYDAITRAGIPVQVHTVRRRPFAGSR